MKTKIESLTHSLAHSKTANLANVRVANIIAFMTYNNVDCGLFGDDKLTSKIMCSLCTCKIENMNDEQRDHQHLDLCEKCDNPSCSMPMFGGNAVDLDESRFIVV